MNNGKSNIQRIEYFEDSQKNIDDVVENICNDKDLQGIKPDDFEMIVYKVSNIGDDYKLHKFSCS